MWRCVIWGFKCNPGTVVLGHQTEHLLGLQSCSVSWWVLLPIPWQQAHIYFVMHKLWLSSTIGTWMDSHFVRTRRDLLLNSSFYKWRKWGSEGRNKSNPGWWSKPDRDKMRNLDGGGSAMVDSPAVLIRTRAGILHLSAGINIALGLCSVLSILSHHNTCHRDLLARKAQNIYYLIL